jgi:hypothetical protein
MSTVLLNFNAFERTVSYKGSSKVFNDDFWEKEISPILTPLWDSPRDRLEMFVYKDDGYFLVQRNKYIKNFKTGEHKWVSYEFDPGAIPEYSVTELYDKLKEKFVEYKDITEAQYEMAVQAKFARAATLNWDKMKLVRKFLLDESDWTQTEDAPLSDDTKGLWKQYRSYLRELFNQNIAPENPYDVVFPITPKEYLDRKEIDIHPTIEAAVGDQGINEEYLYSEWHFWKLTSNALVSFSQKMSVYMTMKALLDEDSQLKGRNPVRRFRVDHMNLNSPKAKEDISLANPSVDQDEYINALITRIENGDI